MLRFAGPIFMVWMMLVIPATAGANAIVIKLSSASSVVHGGDDVVLDLCLKNTTDDAITHELPLSLLLPNRCQPFDRQTVSEAVGR